MYMYDQVCTCAYVAASVCVAYNSVRSRSRFVPRVSSAYVVAASWLMMLMMMMRKLGTVPEHLIPIYVKCVRYNH